mgnify:CR=1 FL=1
MHNIIVDSNDDVTSGVYRMGDYKLIWGYTGDLNSYYGVDGSEEVATATETYYLYNIIGNRPLRLIISIK